MRGGRVGSDKFLLLASVKLGSWRRGAAGGLHAASRNLARSVSNAPFAPLRSLTEPMDAVRSARWAGVRRDGARCVGATLLCGRLAASRVTLRVPDVWVGTGEESVLGIGEEQGRMFCLVSGKVLVVLLSIWFLHVLYWSILEYSMSIVMYCTYQLLRSNIQITRTEDVDER